MDIIDIRITHISMCSYLCMHWVELIIKVLILSSVLHLIHTIIEGLLSSGSHCSVSSLVGKLPARVLALFAGGPYEEEGILVQDSSDFFGTAGLILKSLS